MKPSIIPPIKNVSFMSDDAKLSYNHKILVLFLALISLTTNSTVLAASSTSFNLTPETQNCGGTNSTTSSFGLQDSICESAPGDSTSTSFGISGGPSAGLGLSEPSITFTISTTSIALGTLTTSAVATASLTTTVTTTASNGYITTITTDGTLRNHANKDINAVTDGTVTAGSEEYGIRTSGTDGQLNSTDTSISTTATTIASNTGPVDSSVTTVTFKAAASPTTPAGSFTQTATLIATGQF